MLLVRPSKPCFDAVYAVPEEVSGLKQHETPNKRPTCTEALEPGNGRNVHNGCTFDLLRHHLVDCALRDHGGCCEIYSNNAIPDCLVQFPGRVNAIHDTSIVDNVVEGAKLVGCFLKDTVEGFLTRHVLCEHKHAIGIGWGHFRLEFGDEVLVVIDHDDVCALSHEAVYDSFTKATASTGDEDRLARMRHDFGAGLCDGEGLDEDFLPVE